jgi:hypothetical protein
VRQGIVGQVGEHLKRLRREVGRGEARRRIRADPGTGDDAPTFARAELAEAWGIRE